MSEVTISKAQMDYTIDLLITMTIEEISDINGKDYTDILLDFLHSKTGRALYDQKTGLWHNGPTYIANLYMEEQSSKV